MRYVSRAVVSLAAARFCSASVSAAFVLSLMTLSSVASAQTTDVVGARAEGMAGAFTAVADDASAGWWNPAGLAGGALFNAMVEYGRPDTSADQAIRGVAISYPALGLMYYRLPLRQIRVSATTDLVLPNRQEDEDLSLFGVTVGQSFGNHFVVGTTLKLLRANDTDVGIDVGAMAAFGPLRLGVALRDLTEPTLRSNFGVFQLDRHARAGLAVTSGKRGVIGSATVAVDADLTTTHDPLFGDERLIAVGVEAWSSKRKVALRGGLATNTAGENSTRLSAGLSFAVRSGSYIDGYVTGGGDTTRHGWGLALRVTF